MPVGLDISVSLAFSFICHTDKLHPHSLGNVLNFSNKHIAKEIAMCSSVI